MSGYSASAKGSSTVAGRKRRGQIIDNSGSGIDGAKMPRVILCGKVGAGKSTVLNKICDVHRQAEITDDSCTRAFAKVPAFYDGRSMEIYDGPGCGSHHDVHGHSFVIMKGLTDAPMNAILVTVEFHERIMDNMGGAFFDTAKMLKPDYFDLIVLLVTKMDRFKPDSNFPHRGAMEAHISRAFKKEYDVKHCIFSDNTCSGVELFHRIYDKASSMPQVHMEYIEEEFLQYFDLKAWKGKAQFDLRSLTKKIEGICSVHEDALTSLTRDHNKGKFNADEYNDLIFSLIQRSRMILEEDVYETFIKRNGDNEIDFDDFAASMELRKLIHKAHEDFCNEAKKRLMTNPNRSNLLNAFRRCQYCNEVWVKVEGCDGATTCGARPSSRDGSAPSWFRMLWESIEGHLRPAKVLLESRTLNPGSTIAVNLSSSTTGPTSSIGCGRQIIWSEQQLVPEWKVMEMLETNDLVHILNSFRLNSEFRHLKRERERKIRAFVQLNEQGQDIERSPIESSSDGGEDALAASSRD